MAQIKRKHLILALGLGIGLGLTENIAAQYLLDHYSWAETAGFAAFIILVLVAAYWVKTTDMLID
jgi:hypothetical protein